MPDVIDEIFGEPETPEEFAASLREEEPTQFYPGSKRKIEREPVTNVEFIPDPWRGNFTTKMVNGVETKMFPIGALANALGVSTQSIRHWTRKGYIPLAPYRLPANMVVKGEKVSGRRLYTEPIIEATVEAFEKRGLLGRPRIEWKNHPDLPIEIQERWVEIVNNPTTARSN